MNSLTEGPGAASTKSKWRETPEGEAGNSIKSLVGPDHKICRNNEIRERVKGTQVGDYSCHYQVGICWQEGAIGKRVKKDGKREIWRLTMKGKGHRQTGSWPCGKGPEKSGFRPEIPPKTSR